VFILERSMKSIVTCSLALFSQQTHLVSLYILDLVATFPLSPSLRL
jgi:hypothetical protein